MEEISRRMLSRRKHACLEKIIKGEGFPILY